MKILIFCLGERAFEVLKSLYELRIGLEIKCVYAKDRRVKKDFSDEIIAYCKDHNIPLFSREDFHIQVCEYDLLIALGWRWLINGVEDKKLLIFHDSMLPKYRGYSPLVSALLNKEKIIGASVIYGDKKYDTGNILLQKSMNVDYPTNIGREMRRMAILYSDLAKEVVIGWIDNSISKYGFSQNEKEATYSLWRDEDDYLIDWYLPAETILHFINCVGFPYGGASAYMAGDLVKVLSARLVDDVKIENRSPGKVLFLDNGLPTVVCGVGLLQLEDLRNINGDSILPLYSLRVKFGQS